MEEPNNLIPLEFKKAFLKNIINVVDHYLPIATADSIINPSENHIQRDLLKLQNFVNNFDEIAKMSLIKRDLLQFMETKKIMRKIISHVDQNFVVSDAPKILEQIVDDIYSYVKEMSDKIESYKIESKEIFLNSILKKAKNDKSPTENKDDKK